MHSGGASSVDVVQPGSGQRPYNPSNTNLESTRAPFGASWGRHSKQSWVGHCGMSGTHGKAAREQRPQHP